MKTTQPGLFAHWLASALLGLWSVASLTGCSSTAMKSQPLWDTPGGGREAVSPTLESDRVNVWPFYYSNPPAGSALWPLVSYTDTDHSVIPFYEYLEEGDHLRIGTIHHWLPALAEHEGEKKILRVLNYVQAPEFYAFLPLFWYNTEDENWGALPVYVRDKDEGFWTPLYTNWDDFHGAPGILPIFNVKSEENHLDWNAPWPIHHYESRGNRTDYHFFPLVDVEKRNERLEIDVPGVLPVIYQHESDNDEREDKMLLGMIGCKTRTFESRDSDHSNHFFPLWRYKRSEGDKSFLSPVFVWNQKKEGEQSNGVLPLYYYRRDVEGNWNWISPLVSTNQQNDYLNIMGPLYHQSGTEDDWYRSSLWPLTHWWQGDQKSGHAVFPLYFYEKEENDHEDKPAVSRFISLPYSRIREGDDRFTNVGLLYVNYQDNNTDYTSVLFPLFHRIINAGQRTHVFFPILSLTRDEEGIKRFKSILFSKGERDDDAQTQFMDLGTILYRGHWGKDFGNHAFLWFLANYNWSDQGEAPYRHFKTLVNLFNWEKQNHVTTLGFLNVINNLGLYLKRARNARSELEAEMTERMTEDFQRSVDDHNEQPDVAIRTDFYRSSLMSETNALLLFKHKKTLEGSGHVVEKGSDIDAGTKAVDVSSTQSMVLDYRTKTKTGVGPLFPFLYARESVEKDGGDSALLLRLFDTKWKIDPETDETYRRQRVLWKLFERETQGDRTSMDMFPFYSYDSRPESKRHSFAAGLFGYERDGVNRKISLFWIPIRF